MMIEQSATLVCTRTEGTEASLVCLLELTMTALALTSSRWLKILIQASRSGLTC